MLFAAECDGGTSIRFLDVITDPGANGFAIAQVRSGSFPPGFTGDGASPSAENPPAPIGNQLANAR